MTTISSTTSAATAAANATYLANGGEFLQSVQTTGNWMLDAVNNSGANWMDPSSSGPDVVDLAANAFAEAQTANSSTIANLAISQGAKVMQDQINALNGIGQAVNVLA
jgi:hypothetical protein